jgi:hypothetical protein
MDLTTTSGSVTEMTATLRAVESSNADKDAILPTLDAAADADAVAMLAVTSMLAASTESRMLSTETPTSEARLILNDD